MNEPRVRRRGEWNEDVIIDSGADVALSPLSMADHGEGELQFSTKTQLQDTQGNRRLTRGERKCDLQFEGESTHTSLWKVGGAWLGKQQQRANGDLKVPLNLQNRSLTVLKATLGSVEMKMRAGWRRKYLKLWRKFLTSRFVDPANIPEVEESPELMRTTLVKRGGRCLMPEYCESMMKKEELDEQVFDGDAFTPSITVFSYEPADMGFFAPGYKKLENRKKEVLQAIEEITPTPTLLPRRRR